MWLGNWRSQHLRSMVSTRARAATAQTRQSRQSAGVAPGVAPAPGADRDTAAAVLQELQDKAPNPRPEILEQATGQLLQIDRPDSAAKQLKRKVKAIRNQPSISTQELPELQTKAGQIYDQLMDMFLDPPCPLDHSSSFQLLVAVILSAQTTDKKVNEVTPELFQLAPDAAGLAKLEVSNIESIVRHVGLAPTKARNLSNMSKMLMSKHGGKVPQTFDELELLPGVGHKTASVVMAVAFKLPTFPVDTHIHRLAQRWGLTDGKSVEQTEVDLKLLWPEDRWNALHLRILLCGRIHCPAQGHDPAACPLCSWAAVAPYNKAGTSPMKAGKPRSVQDGASGPRKGKRQKKE